MAEKRVSVRLVAEGGRQVRAELEGIGEAGSRGFGRLSSEMELANARLGSFARKAGIALAAVTAAAAAAGVAMVRSGLDVIGAQADMAASLKTTVESLQVLTWAGELAGVSMGEIEQATKKLTTRLSGAAAGSGSAVDALQRLNLTAAELQALPLDQRIAAIQDALARYVPEAERAAVASDLFGDRAALAFLRIDAATLREAAQDVQDFGVAVSATDAAQIERTGDAIAKLSLIWLGLTNRLTAAVAPALETVANALADMARGTGPIGGAITALFDNIGRLATYAATFAAFMAGRWVAGLAVAALSVRGLATALVFLRGALIRTGIGALIVGAGELVYQFSQLVARVGGVGEACRLLGDLASEAWSRMGLALDAALARMAAGWEGLKAAGLSALEGTIAGVVSFGDRTAAIFQGAYDAAVAIWGSLPGAIGDFAFQAANGLISGVEAMLNGVVERINGFINGLNAALDLLPDWAVGEGGVRIGTLDPAENKVGSEFARNTIPPDRSTKSRLFTHRLWWGNVPESRPATSQFSFAIDVGSRHSYDSRRFGGQSSKAENLISLVVLSWQFLPNRTINRKSHPTCRNHGDDSNDTTAEAFLCRQVSARRVSHLFKEGRVSMRVFLSHRTWINAGILCLPCLLSSGCKSTGPGMGWLSWAKPKPLSTSLSSNIPTKPSVNSLPPPSSATGPFGMATGSGTNLAALPNGTKVA